MGFFLLFVIYLEVGEMGWKAFKEHFKVWHIARVEDGKLYIGSPYIHDLAHKRKPRTLSVYKDE